MKKITAYAVVASVLLMAVSCSNNQGLKKTKSGILYKIFSDGKNKPAKKGDFLKLTFTQKIRDSILYTSADGIPAYPQVDSVPDNAYSVTEIFPKLAKGDSAVVILLADSIESKMNGRLPPFIKKKDKIIFTFKVLDVFTNQDDLVKDRDMELDKHKAIDDKAVQDYINANKINAQKTAAGTFVEVKEQGTGVAVDSGKMVSVLYTGKYMPSGKIFETNMSGEHTQPIKFVIGTQGMIKGWDDGLRLFKKGGKGTLYIPSYLAYGPQPGPDNKPFDNLIFDVEVVDVTDAPKAEAPKSPLGTIPAPKTQAAPKKSK